MPRTANPVRRLFKTIAFLKMKEYERQAQPFRERYDTLFPLFEKKITARKKEDTSIWDDYLVWKGLEAARAKWDRRYKEL